MNTIEIESEIQPTNSRPHCVYVCRHASGSVLYVGASMRIAERLAEHAHGSGWFEHVTRIDIERHDNQEVARRREKELIASNGTTLNIQHVDPLSAFLNFFKRCAEARQISLITHLFEYFSRITQSNVLRICAEIMEKQRTRFSTALNAFNDLSTKEREQFVKLLEASK